MAIALRSASTPVNTGSSTSTTLAVTAPAGVAYGDVILLGVASNGNPASLTCTGFTALGIVNNGTTYCFGLLYKIASGTETTLTVTAPTARAMAAQCVAYSGVSNATPFDPSTPANSGSQNTTASTTVTVASITTTVNGDQLVWFAHGEKANTTPPAITQPSGYTVRGAETATSLSSGNNVQVILADFAQSTAGSSGTVNGTLATSAINGGILVGLQPGSILSGGALGMVI